MSFSEIEKCSPLNEFEAVPTQNSERPKRAVVSIRQRTDSSKRPLSEHSPALALESALRAKDSELDQILSALEEISKGLKSGSLSACSLEEALRRAASCALRQSLLDQEIRNLAVSDDLTGLYNRRGFLAAASHQLKLAHRNGENVLLLFCDVDGLKAINDSFGHHEGDLALVRTSSALRATFRDSDILARLGGDEFAVLASDASIPNWQTIVPRIEKNLDTANAARADYRLSLSIGVARFDPCSPSSLGDLMAYADQEMYSHKRSRRKLRVAAHS
jgi:diguanylate cyclase (GGDEF)-like protein